MLLLLKTLCIVVFVFFKYDYLLTTLFDKHVQKKNPCVAVSLYLLREVAVGQFEGVERREALVVPQQLLLQEADGVQREDDGFVFQQTVDVQP